MKIDLPADVKKLHDKYYSRGDYREIAMEIQTDLLHIDVEVKRAIDRGKGEPDVIQAITDYYRKAEKLSKEVSKK